MFQKPLLIVSCQTAVIQWKVAGCSFEQDVHLQDRSVWHSGFLSVFVPLPLGAFGLFFSSFFIQTQQWGVCSFVVHMQISSFPVHWHLKSHGATDGSKLTVAGSSEGKWVDLLIRNYSKNILLIKVFCLLFRPNVIIWLFSFASGLFSDMMCTDIFSQHRWKARKKLDLKQKYESVSVAFFSYL